MHEHRIEKHLYERKHQTATGEWSRSYYVRLKDWKGVRRVWPAGNNLKTARAKRAEYEHGNALKEDFDLAKVKGMTFATWAEIYLKKHAIKKKSLAEDERMVAVLRERFGNMLLSQITRTKVEEFKQLRKNRLTWRGDPVSDAYCNRELGCLRHILKLAVEEGVIEASPLVKLYKENNARDRALTEEEYQRLLSVAAPHLRYLIICAYETGMRAGEIIGLTWDKVDTKTGFLRLAAIDTKTNEKRAIPISPLLQEALDEIRKAQRERKIMPLGGHVFT